MSDEKKRYPFEPDYDATKETLTEVLVLLRARDERIKVLEAENAALKAKLTEYSYDVQRGLCAEPRCADVEKIIAENKELRTKILDMVDSVPIELRNDNEDDNRVCEVVETVFTKNKGVSNE